MEYAVIGARRFQGLSVFCLAAACSLLIAFSASAFAQTYRLTAEQQRMLDQLPPAQRQQALQALRQLNAGGDATRPQSALAEPTSPLPVAQDAAVAPLMEAEPRVGGNSRVIVELRPRASLSEAERQSLRSDPALARIEGSRYYELDDDGVLALPGVATVPLRGLTAEAIEKRLAAEEPLRLYEISVSILQQEAIGAAALKPFGYDLFRPGAERFDAVTTGPVPPDYVLGPGDTIRIQLFGNVNRIDELEVTRDGQLNLPELGPFTVAGMRYSEFRERLARRVSEALIGTQVSVSMGQLHTIRVFVMGDVERPGSYVVSSLATISSALYHSGGISDIGSLRNVQLKRSGRLEATLDLYDFLLRGDTSDDHRLQPGDVIFVPPLGSSVGVSGAVRRPAIYELKGEKTVGDIVGLAGGYLAEAYPQAARIERINERKEQVVISIADAGVAADAVPVRAGDTLIVPEVLPELNRTVELHGHVQRPGPYELRRGMRLTDLIPSALDLKPGADFRYVLLRRVDARDRRVQAESADLLAAWQDPASPANVELRARDAIHVFDNAVGRQRVIRPILDELGLQARYGEPFRIVEVVGEVRAPGTYPLEAGMRVSDLVRAGGDLTEAAYSVTAELTRYSIGAGGNREAEIIEIDLRDALADDDSADLLLEPHDYLKIGIQPNWNSQWTVRIDGEVRFPGRYRIRRGDTLGSVLDRAGGLTAEAFPEGAIFLRESLREREQEQIDRLVRRLETDLASLSLQSVDTAGSETLSTGQALLAQLRDAEAVGRLVIDLRGVVSGDDGASRDAELTLKDGDRLIVPIYSQVVTVIGEVQQATSHLYSSGLVRDDYLELSGGLTRRADRKLIYVVRANGAVVPGARSRWFGRRDNSVIRPGDTIVVPLETDRIRPLTFWTNVSQILYQGAIAIAAVRTFDN